MAQESNSQGEHSGDSPPPPPPRSDDLEAYHRIAESVGMIPNIRIKDNLVQVAVGGLGAIIGVVVGVHWSSRLPMDVGLTAALAVAGGVAGLAMGVFLAGLVLMVRGWVRMFRK